VKEQNKGAAIKPSVPATTTAVGLVLPRIEHSGAELAEAKPEQMNFEGEA
jgi:hypothetical protein